jgi:hypothetical protein
MSAASHQVAMNGTVAIPALRRDCLAIASRKPLLHVERPRVGQCEPSRGGDMSRARRFALAVVACGVLAGCGVSTPAGPPSARALAHKIPGCGGIIAGTLSDMEAQDVTCTLQDGAPVEIGTFANASDERQWINSGGDPALPDSLYAGCCIQGQLWAATVGFNLSNGPMDVDFDTVIHAIGGRQVQG